MDGRGSCLRPRPRAIGWRASRGLGCIWPRDGPNRRLAAARPTDPGKLGEEVPIGEGKVDFPRLIQRLKEVKYRGPITIEREIYGPRQDEDIRASKAYLEKLIG